MKRKTLLVGLLVIAVVTAAMVAGTHGIFGPLSTVPITSPATAVDHDNGVYVVGTNAGQLYVVDEAGNYTMTSLGTARINDVRIEGGHIAVAMGNQVIELSLTGLIPTEMWRHTIGGWAVNSVDLSADGSYVAYLARYHSVGVYDSSGTLVYSYSIVGSWIAGWLDATADMEYIAVTVEVPPYGGVNSGVELYQFDGSSLSRVWGRILIYQYETEEIRVSEKKDYVAATTSSGTEMYLLDLASGAVVGYYDTAPAEQFAVDGDDDLNYVIGGTARSPYKYFVLKNLKIGSNYLSLIDDGSMNGALDSSPQIDSNPDASCVAFGSDGGDFILRSRTGDTLSTVLAGTLTSPIGAIEIGDQTLLVASTGAIELYPGCAIEVPVDIKPQSCPNPLNVGARGVLPIAILGTDDFDVTQVDPASVRLAGITPLRWALEDTATPFEPFTGKEDCLDCTDEGRDGYLDLTLKFDTQEVVDALGEVSDGECRVLQLTGNLMEDFGGTSIVGEDVVVILKKGK